MGPFKAQQVAELALNHSLNALGKPTFGHNLVQFFKEIAEYCGGADRHLAERRLKAAAFRGVRLKTTSCEKAAS